MTIQDIFKIARIECSAEASDISDETLLAILNENLREFISILQSKKWDEFFAVSILNDIVPEQYKYWILEFEDDDNRVIRINKVLKVRYKWRNIKRVDVLDMDNNAILSLNEPKYWFSWDDFYVFHKEKEVVIDAVEVIWLWDLPEVTINTPIEKIFLWKIRSDERILKLWLKPFIYEKMQNLNAAMNARQFYEKELNNYIFRLWRIKEPIEREIPNLSYLS